MHDRFRDYLYEMAAQAPHSWRAGSVIMSIVVGLIIIGFLTAGFYMEAYPTPVFIAGVSVVTIVDLIILFPFRLWKADKAEIRRLNDRLTAKFAFRIEAEQVFWIDPDLSDASMGYHNYIVGIENLSNTALKNVHVQLDRMVKGPRIQRMRRRLRLRDSEKYVFDLSPKKTEYIWVARTKILSETPEIEFMVEDRKSGDKIPGGDHKIKLKAYAENCEPVNRFFSISAHKSSGGFGGAEVPTDDVDDE